MTLFNKKTVLTVLVWALIIVVGFKFSLSPPVKMPNLSHTIYKSVSTKLAVSVYGVPVRLVIPSINLNADLESVGVTASGAMDVPIGRENAAWFNLGPRPGQIGDAVIDGHYGFWVGGAPAVFNNLNKLSSGDIIYVEENNGITVAFRVSGSAIYSPTQDDTNLFVSTDDQSHLNIITCQGIWNPNNKTYSDRLVILSNRLDT
ncbi:MAG TPA: class F sortase [Candidatus Saccharimonadales bacterium]